MPSLGADLERRTTHRLLGRLEWMVALWQGTSATVSASVDVYRYDWVSVALAVLAALHFLSVPVIARFGGPFTRGPRWIAGAVALVVVVPLTFGLLVEPGTFAAGLGGTPLCNYPASTMAVLAFYPWWSGLRTRRVAIAEYAVLALVAVLPLLLLPVVDPAPGPAGYLSAAFGGTYNVLGFLLGKAIGIMCRTAARDQSELQRQTYEEFFNFLHSHVKAGVAAVRAEWGDPAAMREKLDELEQAVSDRRIQFLLSTDQVPLAALVSERVRTFHGALTLTETPRVGALTVRRAVGILVSRALGDLLSNAGVHGASSAAVRMAVGTTGLHLEVSDDGPGLDGSVLDDPARSLHRLRAAARAAGGDLTTRSAPGGGTVVHLALPAEPEDRRRRTWWRAFFSSKTTTSSPSPSPGSSSGSTATP